MPLSEAQLRLSVPRLFLTFRQLNYQASETSHFKWKEAGAFKAFCFLYHLLSLKHHAATKSESLLNPILQCSNLFITCVKISEEVHSLSQSPQRHPAQLTCTDITHGTDQAPVVDYRNRNTSLSSRISRGWLLFSLPRQSKSLIILMELYLVPPSSSYQIHNDQTCTFNL